MLLSNDGDGDGDGDGRGNGRGIVIFDCFFLFKKGSIFISPML
jgi:hypothetical protein